MQTVFQRVYRPGQGLGSTSIRISSRSQPALRSLLDINPGLKALRRLSSSFGSSMSKANVRRVAVLYQAIAPPEINGVRKPMKPGGYQDSGADIAYNLQARPDVEVITPFDAPDPADETKWCFPDTEKGIISALQKGATHLWANTILFASHPLQTSPELRRWEDAVRVVGQPPCMVEQFDDKEYVNDMLRQHGGFTMPKAWALKDSADIDGDLASKALPYPIVGKPIRGRGSHGVKVCNSLEELSAHAKSLFEESPAIILEEFLAGEEGTVTVMPPSKQRDGYWSMPVVTRFNHEGGIAPYNGVVAVTSNSRVIHESEYKADPRYQEAMEECRAVAQLLRLTAPMRIDIRRYTSEPGSKFALFDVNMKPNMTGPGRPGREQQASLTALAASELGWDYSRLLTEMLDSSSTLRALRDVQPVLP